LNIPAIGDEQYVQEIELLKNNPETQNIPYGFLSDKDILYFPKTTIKKE